jgi:hypothetical protein
MGDRQIRDDVYNFPLRSHWIHAGMFYTLFYPAIALNTGFGYNLNGTLWPNEPQWQYNAGGSWVSDSGRLSVNGGYSISERQYFATGDPRAFLTTDQHWNGAVNYRDPSGLWWARLGANWSTYGNDNLEFDDDTSLFEEGTSRMEISPSVAARVGSKWTVGAATEFDSRYSSFKDAEFNLNRDLHDALLALRLRLKREVFSRRESDADKQGGFMNNMEFSFTVQPRMPNAAAPCGLTRRSTLDKRFRSTALELDG